MRLLTCRYLNKVPGCARVRHLPALRLRADGGKTSVDGCAPYRFSRHVVIHQWGWKVTLNPDGTKVSGGPGSVEAPFAIAA